MLIIQELAPNPPLHVHPNKSTFTNHPFILINQYTVVRIGPSDTEIPLSSTSEIMCMGAHTDIQNDRYAFQHHVIAEVASIWGRVKSLLVFLVIFLQQTQSGGAALRQSHLSMEIHVFTLSFEDQQLVHKPPVGFGPLVGLSYGD
eukprot:GHVO01013209.1.p1 GENE.GHVO01013209.1~~GHVO01013209.1.p1  ORF type:complete len:145 (-),score=14.69 GHVO01013209.1:55-489(-)